MSFSFSFLQTTKLVQDCGISIKAANDTFMLPSKHINRQYVIQTLLLSVLYLCIRHASFQTQRFRFCSNQTSKWRPWNDCTVGARRGDLSIRETADLLGFSHTTVSRVMVRKTKKKHAVLQFCGRKRLANERGQRRMGRLFKLTETQR